MTETAAGNSGPVFRLIYRSRSRIGAAERKYQLGKIFSVARSSNKKLGVTGALLITDDEFVQALEGPEPVVRQLYLKISKDKRHEHLELLESGDVSTRRRQPGSTPPRKAVPAHGLDTGRDPAAGVSASSAGSLPRRGS